jgi:hypothetical protein
MEAVGSATPNIPSNRNNRNHSNAAVYQCRLVAQRAAVPVRLGGFDAAGLPDVRLHPPP